MTLSAPGKLMLLGDYAVLEGGTAMVAAVNRRATAVSLSEEEAARHPSSAVVEHVLQAAKEAGYDVPPGIRIDTSGFRDEVGTKLGLGSSAVVAVLTSALATGRGDDVTLSVAVRGHRSAAQGKGSGVDVAACFSGGVIATKRQPGPIEPLPSRLRGHELFVLYTGQAASTPELVKKCQASAQWSRWQSVLQSLADEGVDAWRAQNGSRFLSVVARYGRAMGQMGKDANAPVVTDQIEAIMRLATEKGAAAKPSGAGGGDVVVLWGQDPERVARIAEETGSEVVDLAVDSRGLSRR